MSNKIKNPKELAAFREKARSELDLRDGIKETQVTIHMGTCGIAAGAREILSALAEQLEQASLKQVTLRQSGCIGYCSEEPMCTLKDKSGKEFRYGKLNAAKIREIVKEHLVNGNPVSEYLLKE